MSDIDIRILDPNDVYFSRGKGGVLQGAINGTAYNELIIYLAFPLQYVSKYISIRKADGEELGLIRDIAELNKESIYELEMELQFRYFLPKVTRVDQVKNKSDIWLWELQTQLGPTRIVMRNLHEYIQYPGGDRIILTDINGKRCEINNWKLLDSHSRRQLEEIL